MASEQFLNGTLADESAMKMQATAEFAELYTG